MVKTISDSFEQDTYVKATILYIILNKICVAVSKPITCFDRFLFVHILIIYPPEHKQTRLYEIQKEQKKIAPKI